MIEILLKLILWLVVVNARLLCSYVAKYKFQFISVCLNLLIWTQMRATCLYEEKSEQVMLFIIV